jgi:hypothetical protein
MKMRSSSRHARALISLATLAFSVACSKGFQAHDPEVLTVTPATTVVKPIGDNFVSVDTNTVQEEPVSYSDGMNQVTSAYKFIHGRLVIDQFKPQFNLATKEMTITGRANFSTATQANNIKFTMSGKINPGHSILTVTDKDSPLADTLKAKVSCVTDTCDDFYVDFAYKVESEKAIYVLRVSKTANSASPNKDFSPTKEPKEAASDTTVFQTVDKSNGNNSVKSAPQSQGPAPAPPQSSGPAPAAPQSSGPAPAAPQSSGPAPAAPQSPSSVPTGSQVPSPGIPSKTPATPVTPPSSKTSTAAGPISGTLEAPKPEGDSGADGTEEGPEEDGLDQMSADEPEITPVAIATLKGNEVAEMFPEILKKEQASADEQLKAMRDQSNSTGQPKSGPVVTENSDSGPKARLSPIGGGKELAANVIKVLESIPVGKNQAVEIQNQNRSVSRKLVNGVNLAPLIKQLDPFSGLNIVHPNLNTFWGTSDLVITVLRIGQWVREHVGNIELDVADLSNQNGGLQTRWDPVHKKSVATHESHQNGIDADLGYIFSDNNQTQRMRVANTNATDFLMDKQWELFKDLFRENTAQLMYVSPPMKKALCQYVKQSGELDKPETSDFARFILERVKTVEMNHRTGRMEVVKGHENHFHLRIKCGPQQGFCANSKFNLEPCSRYVAI